MIQRRHLSATGVLFALGAILLLVNAGLGSMMAQASAIPGDSNLASLGKAVASPTSQGRPPRINYFACEPCVVGPGGSAVLRWDLSGASAAYLDGQGVTAPGSSTVYPDQTTTYRLVAVNAVGQSEKAVTVEVRGLPTIHYLTCLPCEITKGEQSTLSWDLSGAAAAYLDGQGVVAPGSSVVAPGQTTTYRLLAVGETGSVERLVTVTVREGGDPEAVTRALRQAGRDVRWVGYLPWASGGESIGAIMLAAPGDLHSAEIAQQYFQGFETLYKNFPGQTLSVGLYDGLRYLVFASVDSMTFEDYLRGALDGEDFWMVVTWHIWDDWTDCWLRVTQQSFEEKDFAVKGFGY